MNSKPTLYIVLVFRFLYLICATENNKANAPKLSVGFIWETPRLEQHGVHEVLVELQHDDLRLICQINPPLPKNSHNFLARNDIVQWNKVSGVTHQKFTDVYWSDDLSVTAIAFQKLRPSHLGNYSCSFSNKKEVIHVTARNLHEVSHLPKPESHEDFEGLALNLKNTSGLEKLMLPSTSKYSHMKSQRSDLSCQNPTLQGPPNTITVNNLRPEDISVAAFIGGSIVAGIGAETKSVFDLFRVKGNSIFRSEDENDGYVSFSSVLKKFSPKIKIVRLSMQENTNPYSTPLSRAVSQVDELISNLKDKKAINYAKDWKLITVSLDFEDFCFACISENWNNKVSFVKTILDRLQSQVPKAFVNFILPPNITLLNKYREKANCFNAYRKKCFCFSQGEKASKMVEKMVNDFRVHMIHLVEKTQKYNSRDDFAVVLQPLWSDNIVLRDAELENIFAPDCYHLSSYGHQCLGAALWNNMLEPVYNKSKTWETNVKWKCPSQAAPYFFTGVNSARKASPNTKHQMTPVSPTGLRIGLGTFGGCIFVVILIALIFHRNRRRASVAPAIRVLAQPWKRMKEKV